MTLIGPENDFNLTKSKQMDKVISSNQSEVSIMESKQMDKVI